MKIVACSDLHCHEVDLPEGDLLIVAGDMTWRGEEHEIRWFGNYLRKHRAKFKHAPVIIAGNHDFGFQEDRRWALSLLPKDVIYLENSGITIEGLKIWGSPITPTFFDWAFMKDRGNSIRKIWNLIPEDLDVLITHGPPHGIFDEVPYGGGRSERVGCWDLKDVLFRQLQNPPKVHLFGHIHAWGGHNKKIGKTHFYNVAICDESYGIGNAPTVIEI